VWSLLKGGTGVADALYGAGYGLSSRLHENAESWLGMMPASYAKGGKGPHIHNVITDTPLGGVIVSATNRGMAVSRFWVLAMVIGRWRANCGVIFSMP
jgi:AraC family transcriptional regulator of adaptative response/methylated-DNA-[protein]-cysteine methyltransferase